MADRVITSSEDAWKDREHIQRVKATQPNTLHEIAAVNISFSRTGMQKVSNDQGLYDCESVLTLRFCSCPKVASGMTRLPRVWRRIW